MRQIIVTDGNDECAVAVPPMLDDVPLPDRMDNRTYGELLAKVAGRAATACGLSPEVRKSEFRRFRAAR